MVVINRRHAVRVKASSILQTFCTCLSWICWLNLLPSEHKYCHPPSFGGLFETWNGHSLSLSGLCGVFPFRHRNPSFLAILSTPHDSLNLKKKQNNKHIKPHIIFLFVIIDNHQKQTHPSYYLRIFFLNL